MTLTPRAKIEQALRTLASLSNSDDVMGVEPEWAEPRTGNMSLPGL
jgi:hypothetical protein